MRSDSDSVFDTTCFWTELIQSAKGSPARPGHALPRSPAVEKRVSALRTLVDARAHNLRVEEPHRPAAVLKAAVRVLVAAAGRLHDTVEADEFADNDAHAATS
jgi:hypothetical protein